MLRTCIQEVKFKYLQVFPNRRLLLTVCYLIPLSKESNEIQYLSDYILLVVKFAKIHFHFFANFMIDCVSNVHGASLQAISVDCG